MREIDIRNALKKELKLIHANEPDTLIIDELGICQGESRVDLAVVNGSLNGFEIKSDRDTLDRLPRQLDYYNRCFDYMTIVVARNHLSEARQLIPKWWGIIEAIDEENNTCLKVRRKPKQNKGMCVKSIVQFLWKEEAVSTLKKLGLATGHRLKKREELWSIIVESISVEELSSLVRESIKDRGDWRSDSQLTQYSGSSPTSSNSQHSQSNLDWLISLKFPDLQG